MHWITMFSTIEFLVSGIIFLKLHVYTVFKYELNHDYKKIHFVYEDT